MSHPHHRDRRHSRGERHDEEKPRNRRKSVDKRHGRHGKDKPQIVDYKSEGSDGHMRYHHQKFMLVEEGQAPAKTEHIEVIVRQPPPQQVIFSGQEHNQWLSEATDAGPSAKKKRGSEDAADESCGQPTKISEGTGLSMYPLYDKEKDKKKSKNVLFQDAEKGRAGDEHETEDEDEEGHRKLEPSVFREKDDPLAVKRRYGEHCPLCGVGILKEEFTWTGWLFAILCFPCGIFLLFSSKAVTCSHCRQVFHL